MQKHALIIWDDVKAGDAFPEPSNSGPKYNTHPEKQNADKEVSSEKPSSEQEADPSDSVVEGSDSDVDDDI